MQFKRLLKYAGKYKKYLLLCPLVMIGEVVMEMLLPLITARLIDEAIPACQATGSLRQVIVLGAAMLVMACVSMAFGMAGSRLAAMRLSPERRYALNRSFAEECLLPRVFPAGRACLEQHRQAGRLVVIVSASPENYMEFVAPGLGADALLCTQLLSEMATGPNCKGQEKVRRIEAYLAQAGIGPNWADSYAYGDSTSDLPMLRLCAHPVAVNPKRKLRRAAPEMATVKWKEK